MSEGEQIEREAAAQAPQGGALDYLPPEWARAQARSQAHFADPSGEWRRLFAELLGTFLLVVAGAGAVVVNAVGHGSIGRGAAVTAPGLAVMTIILFMGAVSGAHLNPVVSVGFAARGDFPWRRVPGYVLVQLVGATLAVLLLDALFGKVGMLGATV
ncbi:MAG TPA: aquaporin, partial [Solirubrobacteraceae bacterium]|nr:aquaporin [Solirubrobacteraceae bacterium]